MAKRELKAQAIRLRVDDRKSLKEIATELCVALSSVSVWVREHPLTKDELSLRSSTRVRDYSNNNRGRVYPAIKIKDGKKWCPRCKAWKFLEEFYPDKTNSGGRRNTCTLCDGEKKREKTYGVKPEELKRLWDIQAGRCGACGDPLSSIQSAHLDHDHNTGAIRGWLCKGCNFGIGWFRDRVVALRGAANYLETCRQNSKEDSDTPIQRVFKL